MTRNNEYQFGVILDEDAELSLTEICHACEIRSEQVIEMVQEGIVAPLGQEPAEWRFPGPDLARLRRAARLQRDLELNLPGVALALDLLDEIESLRARLHAIGDR